MRTTLIILYIITWIIALTWTTCQLVDVARAAKSPRRPARRPARQPTQQWVRDPICGCAWTITHPLLTLPCSPAHQDLIHIMTRLRPYETRDLAGIARSVRSRMAPRRTR